MPTEPAPPAQEQDGLFAASERAVFPYAVLGKRRFGDPLKINARLSEALADTGEDLDAIFDLIDGPEGGESGGLPPPGPGEEDARFMRGVMRLAPLAARALGLRLLDEETGEGVPSDDVVRAFFAFLRWETDVKKNSDTTPSGSTLSAGPPAGSGGPASAAPAGPWGTRRTSASG